MKLTKKDAKDFLVGMGFLTPNILGFLAFTLIPLVISFCMAFTNWDLEQHNMFKSEPVTYVGLENYRQLFAEKDFYKFLGNTLFFMMGIPAGVAGSLVAALFLTSDFRGGNKKIWARVVATIGMVLGCGILVVFGMGSTAIVILLFGLFGLILLGGSMGGQSVYRTLFYFPHFTAGVATFLLWKKLYNPETGPINSALRPVLDYLAPTFAAMPQWAATGTAGLLTLAIFAIGLHGVRCWIANWRDGYSGTLSLLIAAVALTLPMGFLVTWTPFQSIRLLALLPTSVCWCYLLAALCKGRQHHSPLDKGISGAICAGGALMVCGFSLIGLSNVVAGLPAMAADGLDAPKWINDYAWAKPSIMFMGFWAAVGSNNMLFYIAGISGVPQELHEAADIDGASGMQHFWHVTWPQLAPITFFILVMAVIEGLQGGFEMARTMTEGGPFHATTTLSYYIYNQGFATGRLGYASAISWALFGLVFIVTIINWKFGNRYTNE